MKTTKSVRRAGFSLLEVIVVIAILSIVAGAAVPMALKGLTSKARRATQAELDDLSAAVVEYFRDTLTPPTDLAALEVAPAPPVPGWSGPYLPGAVADSITGTSGYQVDAWSRPYAFTVSGDLVTITSRAEDALSGTTDDLSIRVSLTFVRREHTLRTLDIVNRAIGAYNAANGMDPFLPANYTSLLNTLVADGYLPTATGYQTDAWGAAFVEDPPGFAPVVRVTSSNL